MVQKLTEIKKGQVGTGLLIENDGYVSLDMKENKLIKEAIENFKEDAIPLPRPFVVSAVFQKYGIENANGRIYPENVLKRETEKYQQAIKERRAYGECFTPDVLCLCEDGWKTLDEVKEGDKVLSLNPNTKKIEIATVINKISYKHDGKMLRLHGNNIDDLVTENHKYPVFKRNGAFDDFYAAKEMFNKTINDSNHKFLLKTGEWIGEDKEFIIIKGINNPSKNILKNHPDCDKDISINTSDFMKFIGIYLSDGDCSQEGKGYQVRIHQKKESVCNLIEELLHNLPFTYKVNTRKNDGKKTFIIRDPRLYNYVKILGNCYTKYIPTELKQLSKKYLTSLYEWFVLGDGRVRGDKRKIQKLTDDVFSVSKKLILDLNEIQLKIGYNGSYHIEERNNDRLIDGRLIKGENTHPLHFSLRSLSKSIYLDERFLNITEEYYNGIVECIELDKNHTWYVMSNGKCHWTGNCNHPESSVIDLGRICMNIVELHWVGRTLIGKIEIPISEGFRKYGIVSTLADMVAQWLVSDLKIGVSSRGLGTVSQLGGKIIVNDDYEIVCWDVVSQPSTPNAWIDMEEEGIKPYIEENVETEKNNVIIEDKFSKFDNWLNG